MKKRKIGRTLSRTSDQRLALKRTMVTSLILHKKIQTTLAKAKELRPFVERMITKAKKTSVESKNPAVLRLLGKDLSQKAVVELVLVAQKYADRNGGYTRIIKLAPRKSDSSEMAIIELVGFEDVKKEEKTGESKKLKSPEKKEKIEKKKEEGENEKEKPEEKPEEKTVSDKKDKKQE